MGNRPFKLFVGNNKKIYIPCDRSDNVIIFDCQRDSITPLYMPNNGYLELDELNDRMYVSDTSEVIVYEISSGRTINIIKGFSAAVNLLLNKSRTELYVMDKIIGELKIYRTQDLSLVNKIENLGNSIGCFLLDEESKYIYVFTAEKGYDKMWAVNQTQYGGTPYILKLDAKGDKKNKIILSRGSQIGEMAIFENTLFASNITMNTIEIIDMEPFRKRGAIKTSACEPRGLCISQSDKKLLVANRNPYGYGSIDIIDLSNNLIENTIFMDSGNNHPFAIARVSFEERYAPFMDWNMPLFPEEVLFPYISQP